MVGQNISLLFSIRAATHCWTLAHLNTRRCNTWAKVGGRIHAARIRFHFSRCITSTWRPSHSVWTHNKMHSTVIIIIIRRRFSNGLFCIQYSTLDKINKINFEKLHHRFIYTFFFCQHYAALALPAIAGQTTKNNAFVTLAFGGTWPNWSTCRRILGEHGRARSCSMISCCLFKCCLARSLEIVKFIYSN